MNPALIAKDVAEKRNFSNVNEIVSKKRFSNDICQMKISFILYVFQFFIKNQHLTSHGIMYVFVDFLNFSNLTFHGIMYVFVDFCKKIFLLLISISAKKLKVKKIVQNEIAMRNVTTTRKIGILYVLSKNVHYSKTYI